MASETLFVTPAVVSRSDSYFQDAFAKIDDMRRTGSLLCDVTVVFGNGRQIKAHKLILASSSKFFRTLFVDPTLGFSSVVKVQDSSEEVGRHLIDFAYTAQLHIDEYNVVDVLLGAEKLGFEKVEQLCVEALRTRFDLSRVQGMDLPNLVSLINRFAPPDTPVKEVTLNSDGVSLGRDQVIYSASTLEVVPGSSVPASSLDATLPSKEISAPQPEKSEVAKEATAENPNPVYVELTPGHVVLMTSSGAIRKIKLGSESVEGPPEQLQLHSEANPDLMAVDVEEANAENEPKPKKKKKSSKSSSSPAKDDGETLSDFDRKLQVLLRFEEALTETSRTYVVGWQREPLKRRRVTCALCADVISGTYHDLMEHVWHQHGPSSTRSNKGFHVCGFCERQYANRGDLQQHVRNLHEGESLNCQHCGKKKFANKRNLKAHEAICEKNASLTPEIRKSFACEECDKTFAQRWGLKNHVNQAHKKEDDETRFQCPTCEKTFTTKATLEAHGRAVHLGEKEEPRPCPDCGKPYTIRALREHRKRDHQGLRYACPDCATTKLFTTKIMLTRHREVVHQKRRFRCTLCMAEFVDRCAWKLHHEAEHMGKRYPCAQCQKQFKRPGDVRRHVKEVHQQFRYNCQFCDKSFSQQAKLKLHVRSLHMGNYPHICNLCGKGFLRPSVLKSHVQKQHHADVGPEEMILLKPVTFAPP